MEIVDAAAGFALAMALTGVGLGAGYVWLARLDPEGPTSLRLVGAAVAAVWLVCLSFAVLGSFGAFSWIGLGGVLALVALLGIRGAGPQLKAIGAGDLDVVRELLRPRYKDPLTWGAALVGGGFAVRCVRALVRPPLGTDALTYHLFRAGRFVQTGTYAIEPTPDAGGYYAYYPPLGDALWAVAMLPTGSDALLGLMNAAAMGTLVFAVIVAAVQLGASRRVAAWGALALVATPAIMSWSTAAYVDTFLLAAIAAAVAWLPRAVRTGAPVSIAMVIAGGALAAGIKTTGIVAFGLMGLLMLGVVARRTPAEHRRAAALAVVVASAVALPGLLYAWADHGNPLYPFDVRVAGQVLLPGNEENALLHRGELFPPEVTRFDLGTFLQRLFWPNLEAGVQHLNFGPFIVPAMLLGAGGIAWFRGEQRRMATGLVLLGVLAVFLLKLTSVETLVLRTASAPAIGRFLTVPLLVLVLAGTRAPARLAVPLFAVAAIGGTWLSFPRGLGDVDLDVLRALAPALGIGILGVAAVTRLRGRGRVAALAVAFAVPVVWAMILRPQFRARYYEDAHRARVHDPHPIDPKAAAAHPIWAWLEQQSQSKRIAFASGWDGRGHHWYRSPLLGSQLQHEVVYVSPTKDGALIDYRLQAELAAAADPQAWLQRLEQERIDVLVLCVPQAPEHRWAVSMPRVFTVKAKGVDDLCLAFEVQLESGR